MDKEKLFKDAQDIITTCGNDRVEEVAKVSLSEGIDPLEMINKGFRVGITKMGDLFERGEVFLPELIQSAEVMKKAVEILMESLPKDADTKRGTVVIGTVRGDIHDIGKILVVTMLQANSFEVYDLGPRFCIRIEERLARNEINTFQANIYMIPFCQGKDKGGHLESEKNYTPF